MATNYCRCRIPQKEVQQILDFFSFAKEKMEIDKRDYPCLYRTQKLRLSMPMGLDRYPQIDAAKQCYRKAKTDENRKMALF